MSSRIPLLSQDDIHDEAVQTILENAAKLSTPKSAWYQTLAHNPEMTRVYADNWDATHRGGDAKYDAVYDELKQVFSYSEIVELGCFAAIAIGGVKLSRSLRITP